MNQSFYIGATAAHQQNMRMGVVGNNISNVNTYGFKAEKARFNALMYDTLKEAGGREQRIGVGTALCGTDTDHATGAAAQTGRTLDYMVQGEGFFGLMDINSGEITYTRSGAFQASRMLRPTGETQEDGTPVMAEKLYLTDGDGHFVLSDTGSAIEVTDPEEPLPIGVFDLINYNGMRHVGGTRFAAQEKNGGLRYGTGKAVQGMLETSNVDLAEEFTKMIESQRAYSMALKMVQTSDEIESTINGLRG